MPFVVVSLQLVVHPVVPHKTPQNSAAILGRKQKEQPQHSKHHNVQSWPTISSPFQNANVCKQMFEKVE